MELKNTLTHISKRLFYTMAFLLLLIANESAQAQVLGKANPTKKAKFLPKIYAGVKFGANFSYLSGKDWSNGVKSNMLGGGFAGIRGLGFGVQAEGLFEQSEYTSGSNFYNLYHNYYNNISDSLKKGTFRVNKLCLPLLLQFRVARLFWVQTGVQFYGIVSVRDYNELVKDAKQLFRSGNTAGLLGVTMRIGNADLGGRMIFDFKNLNNVNTPDVWKQYMMQFHVGVKLF